MTYAATYTLIRTSALDVVPVGKAGKPGKVAKNGDEAAEISRKVVQHSNVTPAEVPGDYSFLSTRESVLANIAESRAAREFSNLGGGMSFEPVEIPSKSVERLIAQQNQPRLSADDALAKAVEIRRALLGP